MDYTVNKTLDIYLDIDVIHKAVDEYLSIGKVCSLDFGITKDGNTILVEHNDVLALGNYGIKKDVYFNMIETRWKELKT